MPEQREHWSGRTAFVFAAIGSAVGLGNIWRFPYICYANGGGAFLIPYFVALFTAGIPLMILEFGLGHMMQGSAPLSFAKVGKGKEALGWWAVLVGFVITTYYTVIMAWCFAYLLYSINLSWGTDAQDFFYKTFLSLSEGPATLGKIRVPILIGLLITWASIFLIIYKGTKAVGKVVMLTVPLPIILLGVLVIRGLTLPGSLEGLQFYLTPNFKALLKPEVWLQAYSQIFFSLSLGFGVLIAYASYLPPKSDINNNAFITSLANCGISFFAGFAVFSTLGYLAQATGKSVEAVVASGPGLAFVTYPTIISLLPRGASIFGILFFLMLITLGIDSAFSLVEAAVASGMDKWKLSRKGTVSIVCGLSFLLGIVFTTQGGLFWLDIVDYFMNNFGLVLVGLSECLILGYIFSTKRIRDYTNPISEIKIGKWWDFFIKVVTPLILITLIVMTLVERVKLPYSGYPRWAEVLGGWLIAALLPLLAYLLMRGWGDRRQK